MTNIAPRNTPRLDEEAPPHRFYTQSLARCHARSPHRPQPNHSRREYTRLSPRVSDWH